MTENKNFHKQEDLQLLGFNNIYSYTIDSLEVLDTSHLQWFHLNLHRSCRNLQGMPYGVSYERRYL